MRETNPSSAHSDQQPDLGGRFGMGVIPLAPGDFQGDPRRVVGHPSNPNNGLGEAFARSQESGHNVVQGEQQATVPQDPLASIMSDFPAGILVSRSSGSVEAWRVTPDRIQTGIRDGERVDIPVPEGSVLVKDGTGQSKQYPIETLRAMQNELALKLKTQQEAAARAQLDSALLGDAASAAQRSLGQIEPQVRLVGEPTPLPKLDVVASMEADAEALKKVEGYTVARSYEDAAGFGRMAKEAQVLLEQMSAKRELSEGEASAILRAANAISQENRGIHDMALDIDTGKLFKLTMNRNAKAVLGEIQKAIRELTGYGLPRERWLMEGRNGAATIRTTVENSFAPLFNATEMTLSEKQRILEYITGKK